MRKIFFQITILMFFSTITFSQSSVFDFTYSTLGEWDSYGKPDYLETEVDSFDGAFMNRFRDVLRACQPIFSHHPELYGDSTMNYIKLNRESDVYITFLNETAGYQNVLGFYSHNPNDTAYVTDDKSVKFNGEDQYGKIPYYEGMNAANITLEAWVMPINDNRFSIFRRYGSFQLFVSYSHLYFWVNNTTINTSLYLEKKVWNHIVATVEDRGSDILVKLYINGQLARENGVGGSLPTNNENDITAGWYGSYWYLNGKYDEMTMYNKVLTEEQILERYNNGKSIINLPTGIDLDNDVVFWFDFNNGDETFAENKATLSGANNMELYNAPAREKGVYKHIPRAFRELKNGDITIVFPNVSFINNDRCLIRGNKVNIGHFSAGTVIHWFLFANGFSNGNVKTTYKDNKCFSSDDVINIENYENDRHVVMYKDNPTGQLVVGIEDILQPWGDRDFEDVAFTVTSVPANAMDESNVIGYGDPPANPKADLSLTNNVDNSEPGDGDVVTFTLTVANDGPQTANNISIYDELPNGLEYIGSSSSIGVYDTSTNLWRIEELSSGSSANMSISARVNLENIMESAFDLGQASKFNVFVIDTMQQYTADVEGRLAVGEEAIFDNFTVGYELHDNPDTNGVIIAGYNLTYIGGVVYGGDIIFEHETNLPDDNVEIVNGEIRQDTLINFNSSESYLLSLSNTLSAYTVNGTTEMIYTQLSLTGTNPFLNVFSVNGEDLSNATEVVISVPNGAVALLNINGDNIDWGGGLVVSGTDISNVLYNFYEAQNIRIEGIDVTGTILAPKSHVNFVSGVQNGQMIARALEGAAQYNNVLFRGLVPSDSVLVNIAEIVQVDEDDPDSEPGNGVADEDDYSAVTFSFVAEDTINNTGVEWELVGNSGNGDLIWTMCKDKDNYLLSGNWGGKIYRSTDEGSTWQLLNSDMSVNYIWALAADGNHIFAGTEQGMYVSNDNGQSWEFSFGQNAEIRSIYVKDGNVYAVTWGNGIYVSENNGDTWTSLNDDIIGVPFTSIIVMQDGTIIAGSFNSGIYRSTDAGATFENIDIDYRFVWALALNSDGYLFAGTYGNGVYSSIDGGLTWEKDFGVTAHYIYNFSINANNDLFASSWSSGIFVAENAGKGDWQYLGLAGVGVTSTLVGKTDNKLYASTEDGKLYKTNNALVDINEEAELPGKFALYQNYPNPFNPTTVIKYELSRKTHVLLRIYNIRGREIAKLIDEEKPKGKYQINFDAKKYSLASGVYFYRLETNGLVKTMKMLLVK